MQLGWLPFQQGREETCLRQLCFAACRDGRSHRFEGSMSTASSSAHPREAPWQATELLREVAALTFKKAKPKELERIVAAHECDYKSGMVARGVMFEVDELEAAREEGDEDEEWQVELEDCGRSCECPSRHDSQTECQTSSPQD